MIDKLIDDKGRVTIEGFYDDVVELTKKERDMLAKAPFDIEEYKRFLDIDDVGGEEGYTTWNGQVFVRVLMLTAYGVGIQERELRP
jgi:hypothetical protein